MFVIGVAAPQGRIMYCLQALIYVTLTHCTDLEANIT